MKSAPERNDTTEPTNQQNSTAPTKRQRTRSTKTLFIASSPCCGDRLILSTHRPSYFDSFFSFASVMGTTSAVNPLGEATTWSVGFRPDVISTSSSTRLPSPPTYAPGHRPDPRGLPPASRQLRRTALTPESRPRSGKLYPRDRLATVKRGQACSGERHR